MYTLSAFRRGLMMALVTSAVCLTTSARAGDVQEYQWTKCHSDFDCEAIDGFCGEPFGVNPTYIDAARAWVARTRPKTFCDNPSQMEVHANLNETAAFCNGNICATKVDKTFAVIHSGY